AWKAERAGRQPGYRPADRTAALASPAIPSGRTIADRALAGAAPIPPVSRASNVWVRVACATRLPVTQAAAAAPPVNPEPPACTAGGLALLVKAAGRGPAMRASALEFAARAAK